MDWLGDVAGSFTPDEWQAIGAIGTLAVAVAAAIVALIQVRQAAQLRRDQARPYVVAYLDRVAPSNVDLVVRNFGATAARNIRLKWDRDPVLYWDNKSEPFRSFETLPVLVPGQEWRTIWDFKGKRLERDEAAYTVTLSSSDSSDHPLRDEVFVLSTRHFAHEMMWERDGLHDISVTVARIEKTIGRWSNGSGGLHVVTRDGDAKDEQHRVRREAQRVQRLRSRNRASSDTRDAR